MTEYCGGAISDEHMGAIGDASRNIDEVKTQRRLELWRQRELLLEALIAGRKAQMLQDELRQMCDAATAEDAILGQQVADLQASLKL